MFVTREPEEYRIGCLNWPDSFPSCPEVSFEIWHTGDELHLHYKVKSEAVRAVCASDRDHAWEDSCVEFFFAPGDDGLYYNIECTCTGKIYMCCGPDRDHRDFLPEEAYKAIRRRCSLGSEPFGLVEKPTCWEVWLDIPASTFSRHGVRSFDGLRARGNFYSCGNLLPVRHFLSWAPIETPSPDFHRPEFFAPIEFE